MEGKRMTVLEQRACESLNKMAHRDDPDYWKRLKHQYAGMAMQGILAANATFTADDTAKWSIEYATALVEKLKNE